MHHIGTTKYKGISNLQILSQKKLSKDEATDLETKLEESRNANAVSNNDSEHDTGEPSTDEDEKV